jgi:hypothetical protein
VFFLNANQGRTTNSSEHFVQPMNIELGLSNCQ